MACLETSFLIDVLQAEESAREVMEDLDDSNVRPSVAPVAAAECWVGAHLGSRAEHEATRELLESLTWLPFSRECARLAGDLQATLTREGVPLGFSDCLIAAVALEYDETLVTRDTDFERIPELRVQTY